VSDVAEFLARHRPDWSTVRWIDVTGLGDLDVVRRLAEKYELHPLAVDDVLHPGQRPKVEGYPACDDHPGRLFIVARTARLEGASLASDQVSFFLGRHTLLTFQAAAGDAFEPVRQRVRNREARLRTNDVSFLLYCLLDTLVDNFFPILETYAERLEALESAVLDKPAPGTLQAVQRVKRDLLLLRRAAWPMREVIATLQRESHPCFSDTTRTYLRDVYDHLLQIIDFIETYREFAAGLTETYMSAVSNRMNDIMKTLTIISTIFVPLTFLAGVYGMNMPIPENASAWAYPLFWLFSLSVAGTMLLLFRRRGWF
jgi:magnesium transporter